MRMWAWLARRRFGDREQWFVTGDSDRLILRHTQNLFRGRYTKPHQTPAILAQGPHAGPLGRFVKLIRRTIVEDLLPDFVVRVHPFENRAAPIVPGLAAFTATDRAKPRHIRRN